ncbi:biotin-dependent carboxyltransferase family protein [Thalassotalea castellviae]|uniref:Carboxyltransferase domain-containing protein n=1 Tax=Thalassotalea castellviae TaxID=3075612 RepID=A0ABU3A422_9GAMM|nr:hypothetical protein [Thalassotalea sp. W431]MDT0604930.1 hypothetical protein [Thalassotalea sp. W431]
MPSLTISRLTGYATFQDLGRNTAQHLGFSGSGAADEYSYLLANQLIGNAGIEQTSTNKNNTPAAIEVTLGQLSLVANASCQLVITGADCQAQVRLKHGEQLAINNNQVFTLSQGDELHLGSPKTQVYSYLAVKGGFLAKNWLNSASQTVNENALGFTEAKLTAGSELSFRADETPLAEKFTQKNHLNHNFHRSEQLILRFLPSQLWQHLKMSVKQQFLAQDYFITPQSNRMGYRLTGDALTLDKAKNTLSKPTNFGTIQLPPDGQPIVLMKERQTIGGYPTLGTVIQTDLFRLSQKRPGEQIKFIPATLAQAQAQLLAFSLKFQVPK